MLVLNNKNNQVKIYIQKCNDSNLLLKLNDELLNINHDCDIVFYCDDICKNIDSTLNIIEIVDSGISNLSNFAFDLIISDCAFNEDETILRKLLKYNYSELILTISSKYFDSNHKFLDALKNRNYLKSIISLPIYKNYTNLLVLDFDSNKDTSNVLLIDESDSINHENINDWSLIAEDLSKKILESYENFSEYENALIEPIYNIIKKQSAFGDIEKYIKKDPFKEKTKKRVVPNKVADDLLNSKNIAYNQNVEKNFNVGFKDFFYGKKKQDINNLLYKNNKKIIENEVKFKKLGDIANLKQINKKNTKNTLLISTCKDCTEKLVFNNFNIDEFKDGEVYIEVNIISNDIMADYLKVYLNSTNGLNEIFYFTKGNLCISAKKIQNVRIPVPPKNIQKEIVKASQEANEFFKSIDLLKKEFQSNILDYKNIMESINEFRGEIQFDEYGGSITKLPRNWQHVYNGLIWPLAITYLSATRGVTEILEKLKRYLSLFEFVAAFNFIILLSGLPDNVYQKFKYNIWNPKKLWIYEEMTFGKWVRITKNISKIYKNEDFTDIFDRELFDLISSNSIIEILDKTKNYRDTDAHGAPINTTEAQRIIDELDVYLEKIFEILDIYSNYKLIYVTGKMENVGGKIKHEVILLNGPCAQPIYDGIIIDSILDNNALYLYNPKNNKKLLINSKFMKFLPLDQNKKHWSLFIYYACDRIGHMKTEAKYKCFQSREEDKIESISTFKNDIIN